MATLNTNWIFELYQETEQTSEQRLIALSLFCAEVEAWLKSGKC